MTINRSPNLQAPSNIWQKIRAAINPRPSEEEERQHIISLADQFDKLVAQPGWNKIVEHLAERVNREITEARTSDPLQPRKQTLHVIRWNAQCEILDEALNFVASTRKQRDEILAIKREEEEYVESIRSSR